MKRRRWGVDTKTDHVEPPTIPFIKKNSTGKSDGDYVKLKLRRDPIYSTFDICEFMMSLFDHGELEEFILFLKSLHTILPAIGTLETKANL